MDASSDASVGTKDGILGWFKLPYPKRPLSAVCISVKLEISSAHKVPPAAMIPTLKQFMVAKFNAWMASMKGLKCSWGFVFGS